jgi:protein-disulfide isomerase
MMYRGGDRMSGADGIDQGVRMSIGNGLISAAFTGIVFALFVLFSKGAASESKANGLLSEADVKLYLSDFASLKRVQLNATGLTAYEGAQSAYITIHDFADFRCPHCYHASLTLREVLNRWPGRIRIYYRQFPLDATCNRLVGRKVDGAYSCNGAQAALCAQEQNIFGGLYHGIFDFQNTGMNITPENLQGLTQRLGGEWNRMLSCMTSAKTAAALDRDIRDSQTVNVNSTPTIVVQDRLLPAGAPDHKYFLQLMDALVYEKEGKAAFEEYARRKR